MSVADLDWCGVRVVVFDVDGTLYSQRRLRRRMEGALAAHCALRPWNLSVLRVIAAFRRAREELAALDVQGVSTKQYTVPARRLGVAPSTVQAVVETWMHERPLRYMSQVRFPDVQQVVRAHSRFPGHALTPTGVMAIRCKQFHRPDL